MGRCRPRDNNRGWLLLTLMLRWDVVALVLAAALVPTLVTAPGQTLRLGIAEQMRPVASPYPETDIRLESCYSSDNASARTCQLTTSIGYTPLRPPWETMEVAPATSVKLYCAVARPTGRLTCSREPPEKADAALVIAATMRTRAMLSLYTAAPLLKSGAPAAGAVFSTRISFKPGD